ncbi:MAG: hypothetical protein Q9219_006540 [cf. Caloplaca sp. 3 TL-2023]
MSLSLSSNDPVGDPSLRTHILGSLFSFSREARLKILCDDDTAVAVWANLYLDYLYVEKDRLQEAYEVSLIDIVEIVTHFATKVSKLERQIETVIKEFSEDVSIDEGLASFDGHFQHIDSLLAAPDCCETVSRVWGSEGGLSSHLPRRFLKALVLERIGRLANCQLVLEEKTGAVNVKGDNDQDLARTVDELNKLEKAYSIFSKSPQIHHFVFTEAEMDVSLKVRSLNEANDQRSTTILPPGAFSPSEPTNFGVLLLVKTGGQVITQPKTRNPTGQMIPSNFPFWHDTPILPYGDQDLDRSALKSRIFTPDRVDMLLHARPARTEPFPKSSLNAALTSTFVEQWVEQASGAKANPFEPSKVSQEVETNIPGSEHGSEHGIEAREMKPHSMRKRFMRRRNAPGMQSMESADPKKSSKFVSPPKSAFSTIKNESSPIPPPVLQSSSHSLIDLSIREHSAPLQPVRYHQPEMTDVNKPFAIAARSSSGTRSHNGSQKSVLPDLRSSTPSTYTSAAPPDLLTGDLDPAPAIDRPFMPPISSVSIATEDPAHCGTPIWFRQNPTNRASSENRKGSFLLGDATNQTPKPPDGSYLAAARRGIANPTRPRGLQRGRTGMRGQLCKGMSNTHNERVQLSSEVQSRKVHRTMQQKMARLSGGQASLLKDMESATVRLLQSVTAFKGIAVFEVDIGRMLIHGENNAVGRTFSLNEWSSVFASQSEHRMETLFTNLLPISDHDIRFLTNLRQANGRRIFTEKPYQSTIKYQFLCKLYPGSEDVKLEINETGRIQALSNDHLVGAVNWHFPKRQWDARLAVKIREPTQDHQDAIDDIAKTLCIVPSPDGRTAKIFAELGHSGLVFKSANIIRTMAFRCQIDPDIVMACSEVQYLGQATERNRFYNNDEDIRAARQQGHDLWWEVRLRSATVDKALQSNQDLMLGDRVDWRADDLIRGEVVKRLHSLASEVVMGIDGIGADVNKSTKADRTAAMGGHTEVEKDPITQASSFCCSHFREAVRSGMGPPPPKRRKKVVVTSSEDEETDHSTFNNDRALSDSNHSNSQILPTRFRSIRKSTPKVSKAAETTPSPSYPSSRVKSKTSITRRERKVTPLDKYLSAVDVSHVIGPSRGQTSKLGPSIQGGEEEEEDFIEDDSFDEELRRLSDPHKHGQAGERSSAASTRILAEGGSSKNLPTGSQIFRKADSDVLKVQTHGNISNLGYDDTRPWAEHYGPTSVEELVVHKKKISDVRGWLEAVYQGRSKQKLLILKGASGVGKTATVLTLARSMNVGVLEWKNPVVSDYKSDSYTSTSAQFDDFLARSDKFASLEVASHENVKAPHKGLTPQRPGPEPQQMILIEEFPNISTGCTSASTPFRTSILRYLATSQSYTRNPWSDSQDEQGTVTPLVMIVTENQMNNFSSLNDSFTAHRLLGAEILNHPHVETMEFNSIAPTYIVKALDLVIRKEARDSDRRRVPSLAVLKGLSQVGDVRSAIGSLQFLCLKGQNGGGGGIKAATKGRKGTKNAVALTKMEEEALELVTQREASLGLFHAVGKVVYNKRDGSADGALPTDPPVQPPNHLPQHVRLKAPDVAVDQLANETGTDSQTFIAALHENYVLSCAGVGFIDTLNACAEHLSDTDILVSEGGGRYRGNATFQGAAVDALRQDDIAFQVAVRGLLFSLPYPVRRSGLPLGLAGRSGGKGDTFKMFYPASVKLGRQIRETEEFLERYTRRQQDGGISTALLTNSVATEGKNDNVTTWVQRTISQSHLGVSGPGIAPSKDTLVLEMLPYATLVERCRPGSIFMEELNRIGSVGGIHLEMPDRLDTKEVKPMKTEHVPTKAVPHPNLVSSKAGAAGSSTVVEEAVGYLYLSDDDIED